MDKRVKKVFIETAKALATTVVTFFVALGWYHIDEYLPIVPPIKMMGFVVILMFAAVLLWHFIAQIIKISREMPGTYKR